MKLIRIIIVALLLIVFAVATVFAYPWSVCLAVVGCQDDLGSTVDKAGRNLKLMAQRFVEGKIKK